MKPIKFRAWDKEEKKMVVEPLVLHLNGTLEYPEGGWDVKGCDDSEYYELMLSTGLKDKNGVEAWHKDIVKMGPFLFVITWDVKAAKFYLKSSNPLDTKKWAMSHLTKNGEIIGNVFQNKDLL
jgi:hypothetical protein